MATKTLNTRIALRYDTYANWISVDPVLLAGEMAIANAPVDAGSGLHEPAVLIKVGDGTSKYSELSFITALAGDVLTACKTEAGLTKFVEDVLVSAGVLSGDEEGQEQSLAQRVTGAETAIEALQKADDEIRAEIAAKISTVYKASGSVASAEALPVASATTLGNVYNVTADFETTEAFVEGAGKTVPAGSNVVIVETNPAQGNGFDGNFNTAYNTTGASGTYEVYINGITINGSSFSPSIFNNQTVQQMVDGLNNTSNNDVAKNKPYTFNNVTGEIFNKDGDTVEFSNGSSVISPIPGVAAEYGYDVVGSFIDLTDYYTKSEVDALIPEAVEKALEPTTGEGGEEEKSSLLEKVETIVTEQITTAVDALDFTDTAVDGEFVTAVNEENGIISVVRTKVTATVIDGLEAAIDEAVETALTPGTVPPTEEGGEPTNSDVYNTLVEKITEIIKEQLSGDEQSQEGEDLVDMIKRLVAEAIEDAGKPADKDQDGNDIAGTAKDPSALNQAVNALITEELDKLKLVDNGEDGVITQVTQTKGQVAVVKTAIADVAGFNEAVSGVVESALPSNEDDEPSELYTKLVTSITETVAKEIGKTPVEGDTSDLTEAIKGLTDAINNTVENSLKDVGTPADPDDPNSEEVPPSALNSTINTMIDDKIKELDSTVQVTENEFVQGFTITDGKVTQVTKKEIKLDVANLEQTPGDELILDCGNSGAGASV